MQLRDEIATIAWPGHWSILGGGLEPGESEQDAIIREVQEEAGLKLVNPVFITHVTDHHGSGQTLAVYAADIPDAAQVILGEGQELRFVCSLERQALRVPRYIHELLDELTHH